MGQYIFYDFLYLWEFSRDLVNIQNILFIDKDNLDIFLLIKFFRNEWTTKTSPRMIILIILYEQSYTFIIMYKQIKSIKILMFILWDLIGKKNKQWFMNERGYLISAPTIISNDS